MNRIIACLALVCAYGVLLVLGAINLDSTGVMHTLHAPQHAHRHPATFEANRIHLQAGALHVTHELMDDTQDDVATDATHTVRRHHTMTSSSSHTGMPRAPHKVFNTNFFHASSHALHSSDVHLFRHTLSAAPSLPGSSTPKTDPTEVNLHRPTRATWRTMKTYFSAAGEKRAGELAAMYSNSTDTDSADVESPLHPLHVHPKFHYQWLVQLKSPITHAMIEQVERMITPYKLQHFIPANSYLVSLPYAMALRLREGVGAAKKRGPVLFVCMYHPAMKVQSDLPNLLADRWARKLATRTVRPKLNPFDARAPPAKRALMHELRVTFTHPKMDDEAHQASAFPKNRKDVALLEEYSSKQETYWNAHPAFLRARSSKRAAKGAGKIRFIPVDAHQLVIRMPADLELESQEQFLDLFVQKLASHHSLQYVESHAVFHVSNKHAKYVVQADLEDGEKCSDTPGNADLIGTVSPHDNYALSPSSNTTLFEAPFYSLLNLHGEGQIVTIGDTGVDYDSCFFYDVHHPMISVNPTTIQEHRKIAAYFTAPSGDSRSAPRAGPGDEEGHGTHTAGSLGGHAIPDGFPEGSHVEDVVMNGLKEYSGIAWASKLIVFDFQNPGDSSLYVPNDVYHDYLQVSHTFGSRLSSNSWGDDSGVYDSYARDVDLFHFEHPDYLMVMAAGNLGAKGLHTIATPAVAKNILTVGASMNGVCSFFDQGSAAGIEFTAPTIVAQSYPVTPASFGTPYREVPRQNDAKACYAQPTNACAALTNAAECAGKVVFIERGQCTFAFKAHIIEQAGGILMAYLHDDPSPNYIIDGDGTQPLHVPAITIAKVTADWLRPILLKRITEVTINFPMYFASQQQSEHALSDFSGKGPTLDGRIKPDLIAPGEMIESVRSDSNLNSFQCARSQVTSSDGTKRFLKNDNIVAMQGTSMACPIATGAAAIARQYFTDGNYVNPATGSGQTLQPSAALLKAVLISGTSAVGGTTPVPSDGTFRVPVDAPPSYHQGFGRIELAEVLAYDLPGMTANAQGVMEPFTTTGLPEKSKYQLYVNDSVWIQTNDVHQYCFRVATPAAGATNVPFKATLVWTDPAPTLPASVFLVNNLDLMVVGYDLAGSGTHKVWVGNERLLATLPHQVHFDVNNNVEKVTIFEPIADKIYSVVIRGTNIPVTSGGHGQKYALVVNGEFSVVGAAECPREVYCPNDCSGHGECTITSTPPATDAAASTATRPNTGVCKCAEHYAGSDCSILMSPMVHNGKLLLSILPDQWSYVYYDVKQGDLTLDWTFMKKGGGNGDPDFYFTTPSQVAPKMSYPTLDFYKYVNSECDSCGRTTSHSQRIPTTDLYAVSDTDKVGGGTVILGVFGYCCVASSVEVSLIVNRT